MARRTSWLLLPMTLAVLSSAVGCTPGNVSMSCTPGRQTACACGVGRQGYQVCRDDGASYGVCMGCDDAGTIASHPDSSDALGDAPARADAQDASRPDTGGPGMDTGVPETGVRDVGAPVTGPPPVDVPPVIDTGPAFAWVWLDRGGPAFQPHACRPGPGVVDGMLVDPMAFFSSLVAGRDPGTWELVMNEIEGTLWSCGVGQQRGSGGDVRGRLFLPTASCPDASPPAGDATAIHLGVRQESPCWSHPADVVMGL